MLTHRHIAVHPARAGNSPLLRLGPSLRSVHPRACGELALCIRGHRGASGSSPRVRGTLFPAQQQVLARRFIPARAGNSSPSISGFMSSYGSSPRVRGTLINSGTSRASRRFIPARAGNSSLACTGPGSCAVHPRACGELSWCSERYVAKAGSSPRVRGTLFLQGPDNKGFLDVKERTN